MEPISHIYELPVNADVQQRLFDAITQSYGAWCGEDSATDSSEAREEDFREGTEACSIDYGSDPPIIKVNMRSETGRGLDEFLRNYNPE